jgi:hypothetical protein
MSSSPAGAPGPGSVALAHGGRWWPRRRRAAILAWAALVVVLWNVVFDWIVIQSGRDYLTRQALHQQGRGPAVTIPGVMRPGIAEGFWLATLAAGSVAAIGVLLYWLAARQHRRQSIKPGV